ncbi:hypothetical protein Slin15195_G079260 [Septoria linicola]|uniref:Uncharacterized protein n=1 Tax=Septoria linicola TaxID=215465 RepID=A0A9Q9ARU5_9PEZI|nr:hypothetical protein Slin14017_G040460 [Septoria linicola]USW54607.1 hypothetical protein Slin15195_G079260 [Septoria linicola]
MTYHNLLIVASVCLAAAQQQQSTSIFVPDEFQYNTFDVSVVGNDATATTFEFYPGCAFGPCGPVTLIQGPGTAIFSEDLGPSLITTVWSCKLSPTDAPTTADCSLTSTATFGCCEGIDTKQYPPGTGFAFPTYKAVITAGPLAANGGGEATASSTAATSPTRGVARPTESVFTASDASSTTGALQTTSTASESASAQDTSSTAGTNTMSISDSTASAATMTSSTSSAGAGLNQVFSGRLVDGALEAALIMLAGVLV